MYVYIKSEKALWTVGFYDPTGQWHPESDHNNTEDAAKRTAWLNGGDQTYVALLANRITALESQVESQGIINTAFICRACNNHKKLIEACRTALETLECMDCLCSGNGEPLCFRCKNIVVIEQAIEQAERD